MKHIREQIVCLERQVNEWERISFEECENETERQTVLTLIRKHQDNIRNYHLDLKRTILDCKHSMEHHDYTKERHELLSSSFPTTSSLLSTGSTQNPNRINMDDPSFSRKIHASSLSLSRRTRPDPASREITKALERATHLMTNEVEKSEQLVKMLADSSHANIKIRDEYRGFSGILRETRRLIRHLWQREMTDRCLILLAFLVYLSVVIYIVKRRVFSGKTTIPLKEHQTP